MKKKIILVAVAAVAVVLFFAFDLQRFLTLEAMQDSLSDLRHAYERHAWTMLGGYFLAYVLMAALSLPGAVVMGLAGGAVFGFWVATIAVSFASSLGASLAFLMSRYLFRDVVQRRFADRLAAINAGIDREGAFYLFTLRLIPVFPFFCDQSAYGIDAHASLDLLLGVSSWDAWRDHGFRQCRPGTGTIAIPVRDSVAHAHPGVRAARDFSDYGQKIG